MDLKLNNLPVDFTRQVWVLEHGFIITDFKIHSTKGDLHDLSRIASRLHDLGGKYECKR